jgi:hypothetical protein
MVQPGKLQMKLLLNDKEIANYLSELIDFSSAASDVPFIETQTSEAVAYAIAEKEKGQGKWQKKKHKIKDKIKSGIEKDLREYMSNVTLHLKNEKAKYYTCIHKNINFILNTLGQDRILKNYRKSKYSTGFIKSTGLHIDKTAELVRRYNFNNLHEDCLMRNTVGNEQFLVSKIDNNLPFWFIDSGYTNFIETNKKWHRLVRNHLHIGNFFDAPVDRLGNFTSFPQPWRQGGDKILIIEPGQFAANIFHIDITEWKKNIETELRQYTDKQIVFREKAPKKKREPLYKHLLAEDYYCVVSINSNAATEAIWAGVPVITLDKHISNSVSKSSLADINNLYRGPLAAWLAMLSYSQFTYDELVDGTAVNLIRKYSV